MDKLLSYLNIFWRTVKTDLRQMFLSRMEIAMWSPIRPRFTFYTRCHPKFTPLPPQVRRGQLYVYRYVQTYVRKSGSSQLLVDLLIGIVLCQVIQKCASSDDDFDIKIWYTITYALYILVYGWWHRPTALYCLVSLFWIELFFLWYSKPKIWSD